MDPFSGPNPLFSEGRGGGGGSAIIIIFQGSRPSKIHFQSIISLGCVLV